VLEGSVGRESSEVRCGCPAWEKMVLSSDAARLREKRRQKISSISYLKHYVVKEFL
jgi:hypothetical protein